MKFTTKQVMLVLMSILLVLVIVMGSIVLSKVSGFVQMLMGSGFDSGTPDSKPAASDPIETGDVDTSTTPSTEETESTEPHEHKYVKDKVVSATCTDLGYTLFTCSCGKTDVRDMVDAKGHLLNDATVVPATCEQDGYTEQVCSRCKIAFRTTLKAASHNFGSWTENTITIGASQIQQKSRTCSTCKVVEFINTDTANLWTLRRYKLDSLNSYTYYKLVVDLADENVADPVYHIYTKLAGEAIHFTYGSSGLTLGYTLGTQAITHVDPIAGDNIITIKADGSIELKLPTNEPVQPSQPSTEPSEPGTQPSVPDTHPSTPGTQPSTTEGTQASQSS